MAKRQITTTLVKNTSPAATDIWVSDTELRGFGLRVRPNGSKYFVYRYQLNGKRKLKILGPSNVLTVARARKAALELAGVVAADRDPLQEEQDRLEQVAREKEEAEAQVSLSDFCDIYLEDAKKGLVTYRQRPKKASTLAVDDGRIERHIKPIIGKVKLPSLTGKDVSRLYEAVLTGETAVDEKTGPRGRAIVTGGPTAANRAVGLLGGILSYARKKHLIEGNPVQGFEKHADKERDRVLTDKELKALGNKTRAIEADEEATGAERMAAQVIRVLLLSGCRASEITAIKKDELDVEGSCIRFGDTKTGRQVRALGSAAISQLQRAPGFKDDKAEYLYPATRGDGSLSSIGKIWRQIRDDLKLEGVTPHSFRHTFATIAHDELGYSERTIDGLLGHAFKKGKYIHTVDRTLVMTANSVSAEIEKKIGERTESNVVALKA
jgi:integrase